MPQQIPDIPQDIQQRWLWDLFIGRRQGRWQPALADVKSLAVENAIDGPVHAVGFFQAILVAVVFHICSPLVELKLISERQVINNLDIDGQAVKVFLE